MLVFAYLFSNPSLLSSSSFSSFPLKLYLSELVSPIKNYAHTCPKILYLLFVVHICNTLSFSICQISLRRLLSSTTNRGIFAKCYLRLLTLDILHIKNTKYLIARYVTYKIYPLMNGFA